MTCMLPVAVQAGDDTSSADRIANWQFGTNLRSRINGNAKDGQASGQQASGKLIDFPMPDGQMFQDMLPKSFRGR